MNLPSWKAVGLRTGDVLELGLRLVNVSVACQFCALLSHFLTVYHLVTVVDSCCITRSHVFLLFFYNYYYYTQNMRGCVMAGPIREVHPQMKTPQPVAKNAPVPMVKVRG